MLIDLKILHVMVNDVNFIIALRRQVILKILLVNKYNFCIRILNCKAGFTFYGLHCSLDSKQRVGRNIVDFRYQIIVIIIIHFRNFLRRANIQKCFKLTDHKEIGDLRVILIHRADCKKELRRCGNFGGTNLKHSFPTG